MKKILVMVMCAFSLVACDDGRTVIPFEEVQGLQGDAVRGETLYTQAIQRMPTCDSCHKVGDDGGSPDLTGYGSRADQRVVGLSAEEYTFYSIAEPGRYIVQGYGNAMYNQYDNKMTAQDIADLMAYLLSL